MGRQRKLLWRLGLLGALVSICLSAYLIARAQGGPSWEVPATVVMELQRYPVIALLLAIVAGGLYLWCRRFGDGGGLAQRGMVAVVLVALILPLLIWVLKPEQWPYQSAILSMIAVVLFVPTVLVALFLFWLIGFKWLNGN